MVPSEYIGREQTWLKHRVLREYLSAWAHKLGSSGRGSRVKLWYVDCFSGPWQAKSVDLSDTSVHIGLTALQEARASWIAKGAEIELGAIFVEKDPGAFRDLQTLVQQNGAGIDTHPLPGKFGDHVSKIDALVGKDPAFLLIDPTGWDGAAMQYIEPLARVRGRDVLVNVMFDHMNRFKDDPRAFLRVQMRDFFGLADAALRAGMTEQELLEFYRERLRTVCRVPFTADLAVPHPTVERTKFRLVVGGHHREVLRLFRDVERRVVGEEAAVARTEAKERDRLSKTGQFSLLAPEPPKASPMYASEREEGLKRAKERISSLLVDGPIKYEVLWPRILESYHITESDLASLIRDLVTDEVIDVADMGPRERRVKDHHELRAKRK